MHWILQTNLWIDNGSRELMRNLDRFEIPHTLVTVSEADKTITPEVEVENPVLCIGSITFSKIARDRGWKPGVFFNDNFDFRMHIDKIGGELINGSGRISSLADAEPLEPAFFIRPCDDTKSLNGTVMTPAHFQYWRHDVMVTKTRRHYVTGETLVLIAPVITLLQEYRIFVVNGEAVTWSRYKLGGVGNETPLIDDDMLAYARRVIALWQPAEAFVIDIARTPTGFGIVEYGCINHAGFYAADIQRLMMALDVMS